VLGPHRIALVTDAMAAAGTGDGTARLGSQQVEVVDGVARVAGTPVIAGGTSTLAQVLSRAVLHGVGLADAAVAATSTPARAVGLGADVGVIAPGCPGRPGGPRRHPGGRRGHEGGRWLTDPPAPQWRP
jgi:N-acetylglucosamine-6-phosphate deacetylase